MKPVYRQHTHSSSFFWKTSLSEERMKEIIAWVKSLSNEDAEKLQDLLSDVRDEVRWNSEDV